tara:strand:- start:8637 stop:8786 length:150 start_codon:yes stop_codon:yes gene_type:complete
MSYLDRQEEFFAKQRRRERLDAVKDASVALVVQAGLYWGLLQYALWLDK